MIPYRTFPGIELGPLTVRTFGLFVGIGALLGTWILLRHARRRGISEEPVVSLAFWVLVGGVVGARLTFVLADVGDYLSEPLRVFALWEGGLHFSGGFIAAIVVILVFLRRHPDLPGWYLADGMALGLAPGLAVGRLGCYAVGEHLGGETDFFLATEYLGGGTREGPIAVGATIHNTALYEFILLWPLFVLLWWLRKRGAPPGTLVATFAIWYGAQRFLTDFLRAYDEVHFGLTGAQWLMIPLFIAGLVLLKRRATGRWSSPVPSEEQQQLKGGS